MAKDFYETLGVPRDASAADIKKAFRQIARECHPDVAGDDPVAQERFLAARQAYETLSDPERKERYDTRAARRPPPGGSFFDAFYRASARQPDNKHAAGTERRVRRQGGRGNEATLEDLFADFGQAVPPPRASRVEPEVRPPPHRPPEPGADVEVEVRVNASLAQHGGTVTVHYARQQRTEGWRGGEAGFRLARVDDVAEVRVLPGTRDGELIRERGLGDAGAFGGPYGDLCVKVRVEAPLEEEQVQVLPLAVHEALLGAKVEVNTPQGLVRLAIPACTSGGARLRLRGKGAEKQGGTPGDLLLEVQIVVPERLDAESQALIEQFARLNPGSPRPG